MEVTAEWAGKERSFRLRFGDVMDLEEACGEAIGTIFIRVTAGQFKVTFVYHTIRLGLVGAGMSLMDAKRLLADQFDARPYMDHAGVAGEILAALMVGVEPTEGDEASDPARIVFSEVSQICRVFNMSPQELRDMRYADFVNLLRGFNASSDKKAAHITEEEFMDILNRYEPEAADA